MINTILNILPNVHVHRQLWTPQTCSISLISQDTCIMSPCGHKKLWGTRTPAQTLRIHPLMKAPSGHSCIGGYKKVWFRQKSLEMVVMLANSLWIFTLRVRTDYAHAAYSILMKPQIHTVPSDVKSVFRAAAREEQPTWSPRRNPLTDTFPSYQWV